MKSKVAGIIAIFAIIGFAMLSCDDSLSKNDGGTSTFKAVTNITGIPSIKQTDTALTLNGTVVPSDATNKVIIWSIAEDDDSSTEPTLNNNILTTEAEGTVKLIATIAKGLNATTPYTKTFTITVTDDEVTGCGCCIDCEDECDGDCCHECDCEEIVIGGGGDRYIQLTVNDFSMFNETPENALLAVFANEGLTQVLETQGLFPVIDSNTGEIGNVYTGMIKNTPSNNTVYAVVLAYGRTGGNGYWVPKVFTLELGTPAANEQSSPKELAVNFGNVSTKTINISYGLTINGANPNHPLDYMQPKVGFYFEVPGLVDGDGDLRGFDIGGLTGYGAVGSPMTVPNIDTLPFPIYFSAFAFAEGALDPTIKLFTTGDENGNPLLISAASWILDIGEIAQTISGTVDPASFDLQPQDYSKAITIFVFNSSREELGKGALTSGSFSFIIPSSNTPRTGAYAMVVGVRYDTDLNADIETIRYSNTFTIPIDSNHNLGALTYNASKKHPAITFNMNGGNVGGNTANITITAGANFQVSPMEFPEAVRVVHALDGWNTEANGSGTAYNGARIDADLTVYAQWRFEPITVTFDVNGGIYLPDGGTEDKYLETNTSGFIDPLPQPARHNYRFEGWNTEANGSGTTLTVSTPVTSDMFIVYAQWTFDASVVVATITFNANGGSWNNENTRTQYALSGGTTVPPNAPTSAKPFESDLVQVPTGQWLSANLSEGLYRGAASNCDFDGWNLQADGNGSAFTESSTVSEAIIVYAKWIEPANPQWVEYKYNVAGWGANFYESAWNYINSFAGDYILMLGSDVSDAYREIFSSSSIIIVGVGGRRIINASISNQSFGNPLYYINNSNAKLTIDYNITLNGNDMNRFSWAIIHINSGQLIMNEGAIITGGNSSGNACGVNIATANGIFTINSGTISGNNGNGGVINQGTFVMNGGTISNNTGDGVVSYSSFIMNNGTISNNSSRGANMQNGTFTMNGGTISNNTGSGVAGIQGIFTLNDGIISSNGGGFIAWEGTIVKTGGIIYGNDAGELGNIHSSGNGHAVTINSTQRFRNTTAGPEVTFDSRTDTDWEE